MFPWFRVVFFCLPTGGGWAWWSTDFTAIFGQLKWLPTCFSSSIFLSFSCSSSAFFPKGGAGHRPGQLWRAWQLAASYGCYKWWKPYPKWERIKTIQKHQSFYMHISKKKTKLSQACQGMKANLPEIDFLECIDCVLQPSWHVHTTFAKRLAMASQCATKSLRCMGRNLVGFGFFLEC